jgi:triacylglycerol lipase
MFRRINALTLTCFCFLSFTAPAQPAEITTQYPIVLVHGLLGFDTMLGAVEYWNGIPDALRKRGLDIYVAQVSKLHSTAVRGEQLAAQVEEILTLSGAQKVNIIGHSHGGLDARYVAANYAPWVASVTSVGTPHQGALLADLLIGKKGFLKASATTMLNAFGKLLALLSGDDYPQDAEASLKSFTTESLMEFNQLYPAGLPTTYCGEGPEIDNGIRYYSWGGKKVWTSYLDFTDYVFAITALADDRETDGLVERCSSHLGKVIRDDYGHNHVDLINGMWGLVGNDDINPIEIFIEHALRLQNDGL